MRKDLQPLIAGLDIGSSAIRIAIGQIANRGDGEENSELQILGASSVPSAGVNKGVINSIEDVVSSVSACLEGAERMVGAPIDSAWVAISGLHIISQHSKGVVAVSKVDNEISEEDVRRAIEASRAIATPLNYEVLHVLPKYFTIDGQSNVKDPVGMTGIRLEVDSQIILGSSSQIKNLTKAVYRTGLEIEDLVLGILASADAVLTSRQKEIGVMVVNIGVATTSLVVFEEGEIIHTAILPVGSEHITNDIAIGLRTSIDIAEAVKIEHGDCTPGQISKREEIDLASLGSPEHEIIKKQYLSDIIEARVEEILHMVDQELIKIKRNALLPSGVVFTGSGAKLAGLIELTKKQLRLPAVLGYPLGVVSATDKVNDLSFSTAVGLVKWGGKIQAEGSSNTSKGGWGIGGVSRAGSRLKNWVKALIP